MERDNAENSKTGLLKKMTEEALASLCEALEAGKSEELVRYLDVMSQFPKYSFRNVLLILSQMPEATKVMGYQSWKQIGRQVRKEEKAIRIWKGSKEILSESLMNIQKTAAQLVDAVLG